MKDTLLDVSGKIDPLTVSLYRHIQNAARAQNIDFVIIGATARDIIYEHAHKINFLRVTKDIDFAVQVLNWQEFDLLTNALIETGQFSRNANTQNLVFHGKSQRIRVDIIPFGPIENESGHISWPPEHEIELSIVGFQETLDTAVPCRLSSNPELILKVAHPATMILLKLFAWKVRRHDKNTDPGDIAKAIKEYQQLGNADRIFDDPAITEADDFDFDIACARLVGRDIAIRTAPRALDSIRKIMLEETNAGTGSLLLADMRVKGAERVYSSVEDYALVIRELYKGLLEPELGLR